MTHNLTDPRVQRTRKLLKDALIELSAKRGFDAVTVGDIVGRAKINRATFYRHYQDKYALVEEIFQEAMDSMRRDLKPPSEESVNAALQNPPERLVKLFERFADEIDMPKTVGLALAFNLLLSTVTWWLENGKDFSPKQMAKWFVEFVMYGYVRILGL
jgi:AcrR family transcriptional regulator